LNLAYICRLIALFFGIALGVAAASFTAGVRQER